MLIRSAAFLVSAVLLGACSVGAYTPVLVTSASGQGKQSLNEASPYDSLVGRWIVLKNSTDRVWTLRRFSRGRHFIELSSPDNHSTQLVCRLAGRPLRIDQVFEDRINGGIHYSATTSCADGKMIEAPRNHWLDDIPTLAVSADPS